MVIRDSNGTIKMGGSRHLDNVSIITIECVTLRDEVVTTKYNDFLKFGD